MRQGRPHSDSSHFETIAWTPPTAYATCDVYGRASGAELLMTPSHVAHGTTTFKDDGSVTPSGAKTTVNQTSQANFGGNISMRPDGRQLRSLAAVGT